MVWGGAVNLAAADDKLIRIRHPLSLDPRGMLLASILAKKKAVGATDVIIDIPIGRGAKIKDHENATILAKQFNSLGQSLGMNIHSLITNGDHPIGNAIGPVLEAREVLRVLSGSGVSPELKDKSCQLSGVLLELAGVSTKGSEASCKLIDNGSALKKFREIIGAQGGDSEVTEDDLKLGVKSETIKAQSSGRIYNIDNKEVSTIAKLAGCPDDKQAGIYLHVEQEDKVKKGQDLFTIYSNNNRKLNQALEAYERLQPITYTKIILDRID